MLPVPKQLCTEGLGEQGLTAGRALRAVISRAGHLRVGSRDSTASPEGYVTPSCWWDAAEFSQIPVMSSLDQ